MAAKLNPKHQAFIAGYLKHGNATLAYQSVYNCKEAAAAVNGSKLLRNAKIVAIIAKAQEKASIKAGMTLQAHLDTLETLRDAAKDAKQYNAAINAEVMRGKCSGFYVDRVEHSGSVDLSQSEREQAVLGILSVARKRQKELVS